MNDQMKKGSAATDRRPSGKHLKHITQRRSHTKKRFTGERIECPDSLHDFDSEQAVLGCLIVDPARMDDVVHLRSDDFFHEPHQLLFSAIKSVHQAGTQVDPLLVTIELKRRHQLQQVGTTIKSIIDGQLLPVNLKAYVDVVKDYSRKRELRKCLTDALQANEFNDASTTQQWQRIGERASDALSTATETPRSMSELLTRVFDRIIQRQAGDSCGSIPTGFAQVDELLAGLHPGELSILAARPGMGKTSLALNIALNVSTDGHGVLFVSLEMDELELISRCLCLVAAVNNSRLRGADLSAAEQQRLLDAADELKELPLTIRDSIHSLAEIESEARQIARAGELNLVIIDYLQLIEPDDAGPPRHEQVSKMSRQLKRLAKTLEVPILVLSQLNRESANAKNHRPQLSHLRESGAIEQDADVVMFVHRPSYFLEGSDRIKKADEAELVIAKQRNGPIGDVELVWDANTGRFSDPVPEGFSEFDEFNESRYRDGF